MPDSRGIAYRSSEPNNFLCFQPGPDQQKKHANRVIKLVDFELSAVCHGERHGCVWKVGTDGFMAPEIMTTVPYERKQADIISLGCLLHLLLAGSPPKFRDDGKYEVRKLRHSAEALTKLPLLHNFGSHVVSRPNGLTPKCQTSFMTSAIFLH